LAGAAIGGGAAWLAGAKIGGTIGSAAGPLGTILGVGAGALLGGAVAGTATLIAEHKEKKWLKNEENQQVLKDLATLDLKEQESYQKLSEEQKMAVNTRVAAAKDMYDFTKGSVE
jgi:phage tail tape-measure protein